MKSDKSEVENPLVKFLLTLKSACENIQDALDEVKESGKGLPTGKSGKRNIQSWSEACVILETAREQLEELHATVLSSSPKSVQDEVADVEDFDASVVAVQATLAQMRACLMKLPSDPLAMACEAACCAADAMFRTQITAATNAFERSVESAEKARDASCEMAVVVYKDTCTKAMEACDSLFEQLQTGQLIPEHGTLQ